MAAISRHTDEGGGAVRESASRTTDQLPVVLESLDAVWTGGEVW